LSLSPIVLLSSKIPKNKEAGISTSLQDISGLYYGTMKMKELNYFHKIPTH